VLNIAQVHTNLFCLKSLMAFFIKLFFHDRAEVSRHFATINLAVKTGQPGLRPHGTAANKCLIKQNSLDLGDGGLSDRAVRDRLYLTAQHNPDGNLIELVAD